MRVASCTNSVSWLQTFHEVKSFERALSLFLSPSLLVSQLFTFNRSLFFLPNQTDSQSISGQRASSTARRPLDDSHTHTELWPFNQQHSTLFYNLNQNIKQQLESSASLPFAAACSQACSLTPLRMRTVQSCCCFRENSSFLFFGFCSVF